MWTRNFETFPHFTHNCLEKHLILDSSVDREAKGAMRHKKLGYQLFKAGYVHGILIKPNVKMEEELFCIVRGRVKAQMKQNEYTVYAHFNEKSGEVSYAHCECPAGKGGCCKHVAALLFQILDYRDLELSEVPDELSCTERLQTWNVPITSANLDMKGAVLFEDLLFDHADFEKDKLGRKRPPVKGKRDEYKAAPSFAAKVTKEDIQRLRDSLSNNDASCPLVDVLDDCDCQPFDYQDFNNNLPSKVKLISRKKIINNLHTQSVRSDILKELDGNPDFSLLSQQNITIATSKLAIDLKGCQEIERNTRGQADCPEWFNQRKQRLTSSNFGSVIKRRESIFPKSILNIILGENKSEVSKSCKWGKDNEENALLKYFEAKETENIKVCRSVGLVVSPKWPWLGGSPDALVCDPQEPSPNGAVEIKCPSSKINRSIREACEDTKFYLEYTEDKARLKKDLVYFYQIQGIMAICKLSWVDFVVYTVSDLHVERIYFNASCWENSMLPKLTDFFFKFLI